MVKSPYELDTTIWEIAPGKELQTNNIAAAAQSQPLICNMMSRYDFQEAEEHMEHIERERQAVTDGALIFLSDWCNRTMSVDNCPFFNIKNRKDCPVGGFSCDKIKPDDWKHYFLEAKKPSVSNEDTTPGDMEDTTPGDMWDIL